VVGISETTAGPPSSAGDPDLRALEDRLRVMLGTRVRIRGNASSGSIIVAYYDEQDLQRLADLLGLS